MKKLFLVFTLFAFTVSPMALGAQVSPEQVYKDTYIALKKGQDSAVVLNRLLATVRDNNLNIKDVLESAVARGWMSQRQLNVALEVVQKNAQLAHDDVIAGKARAGALSAKDVRALSNALEGNVTGAAYYCGYYGCYRVFYASPLALLLIALLLTPAVIIVY